MNRSPKSILEIEMGVRSQHSIEYKADMKIGDDKRSDDIMASSVIEIVRKQIYRNRQFRRRVEILRELGDVVDYVE